MTGRIRNPWVVVAAYNEAPVVGSVVSGIRRAGYAVVVVDDGSSDRTGDVALLAGAVVVRHPVNLGQGAALQTGIDYALEQRADALVTFDADGQHSPVAIAALLAAIEPPGIDFALGSRFLAGATANLPVSRHILLSAALLRGPHAYDIVHVNAELAGAASDHDPQVVRLYGPGP